MLIKPSGCPPGVITGRRSRLEEAPSSIASRVDALGGNATTFAGGSITSRTLTVRKSTTL